jgi:hypothetical protein
MKKEIGDELIKMEVIGHEEMEASDVGQIDSLHLQNIRRQKSDAVDDQQIFCDGWYAEHFSVCSL